MAKNYVLVTGSRTWGNGERIGVALEKLAKDTGVIHGAARGADSLAGFIARLQHRPVREFPAKWDELGKDAGPLRNRQMLDEGKPYAVHAFIDDPVKSAGTANMVLQALLEEVRVTLHLADGRTFVCEAQPVSYVAARDPGAGT